MGKGWTEEWQGLGCGEGGGKVGCAKACGQTFELAPGWVEGSPVVVEMTPRRSQKTMS